MPPRSDIAVPDDVRKQFPDIVELILSSESMNDEERTYWLNALPGMKPEQVASLKEILTHERDQLALIDAKYGKQLTEMEQKQAVETMQKQREQKRHERRSAEEEHKEQERLHKEKLLEEMDSL